MRQAHPTADELKMDLVRPREYGVTLPKLFIVDEAVSSPIEVLTNLVYLTRHNAGDETKILFYMMMADEALEALVEALKKVDSP